jgi:phenylacetate-CoA ligase
VSAEPFPPSLRAWLGHRIPTVREAYGTAEAGNLGYECAAGEGLHVPSDALVQVVDLSTGAARHDQGEGQVVVSLLSADYPLIRFGTGDLSRWLPQEHAACPTPRLAGWLGRVGDAVKVKGMFLHPRQVRGALDGLEGVDAYRLVIDRVDHKDALRCQIVAAHGDVAGAVRQAIRERLRFTAEVEVVDDLPTGGDVLEDRRRWE